MKDTLNMFKLMRCGLLSNIENRVKDGYGMPIMTQILVKYWPASAALLHIGKRNDSACRAMMKKLSHLQIYPYRTDDWKSCKKYIPKQNTLLPKLKLFTLKGQIEISERI